MKFLDYLNKQKESTWDLEGCKHCPWKHPIYISVPSGGHVDVLCHVCGSVQRIFSQHVYCEQR